MGTGPSYISIPQSPPSLLRPLTSTKEATILVMKLATQMERPLTTKGKKLPAPRPTRCCRAIYLQKTHSNRKKEIKIIKREGVYMIVRKEIESTTTFFFPRQVAGYHQQNKSVFCFPVTGHRKRHSFFAMGGNSTDTGLGGDTVVVAFIYFIFHWRWGHFFRW